MEDGFKGCDIKWSPVIPVGVGWREGRVGG